MTVLLRIPQVAERVGVSARSIHRLIASGELRAVKIGQRSTRIRTEDLETFIAKAPSRSASKTEEGTK